VYKEISYRKHVWKTNKLRQFPTRWIPRDVSYEELKSHKHSKQHGQLCQKDKKICPLRCVCVCLYIYITMNYYLQWNLHTQSFEMLSYHLCFFFFQEGVIFWCVQHRLSQGNQLEVEQHMDQLGRVMHKLANEEDTAPQLARWRWIRS